MTYDRRLLIGTDAIKLDKVIARRNVRYMSTDELYLAINDCQEAYNAMPDGIRAEYYQDELHIFIAEIKRRTYVKDKTYYSLYKFEKKTKKRKKKGPKLPRQGRLNLIFKQGKKSD